MTARLLEFPAPPRFSLPQTLRDLADRFEAGEYAEPLSFTYVIEGDEGVSWGLIGEADFIRASALLSIAADCARGEALE